MVIADNHDLSWLTPSPLWGHLRGDQDKLARPAILRFETDDFMEELFALVAAPGEKNKPPPLAAKIAEWRRFGERPDGAPADWATKRPASAALKLYQPVHGHFHLVVASLVCDVVGRPDHAAPPAQVGFVMRRLSDGGGELAWVPMTPDEKRAAAEKRAAGEITAAAGLPTDDVLGDEAGHVWKAVPAGAEKRLVEGEVVLAAFAVPFSDERGQPRRFWAALVPASSPEARLLAKIDGVTPASGQRFALRAVLRKPSCPPSRRHVMSKRSEPFRIASYADPDAPSRAIVIPLPAIPDPMALLKRFPKKAKFLIPSPVEPEVKLEGVPPEPKVLPGPSLPAMCCSMSIPIITFCAYVVLSIVLSILNIVFRWLEYVKVCFGFPPALAPGEE